MNNRHNSRSYYYVLDHYSSLGINGEEKLENRFLFLLKTAQHWISCLNLDKYVGVSTKIIRDIVEDYFADIIRLKQFHDLTLANVIKVASYTAYWVNRRKPLYYKDTIPESVIENNPRVNDINEWYAINLMLSMVYDSSIQYESSIDDRNRFINFIDVMHYTLTYRTYTPQTIELALVGLEAVATSPRLHEGTDGD
ncbi:MAG: hypothetical protein ACOCWZ_09010 [Spirochaetota bacterium]